MKSKLFKYLIRPALGTLALLLCLILLLHTSWGLNLVAQSVLSQLQIFPNARLSADRVDGRPFSRLSLHQLRLSNLDDSTLVAIENVQVGYRLWPMLKGKFYLSQISITNPRITITQQEDLSWDLPGIVKPGEDTTESAVFLSLDQLKITDGHIEARTYAKRDSTYQIENLDIQLSQLLVADDLSFSLDNLEGNISIPQTTEPVNLVVAAAYDGASVVLDSLSLRSANSYVDGKGQIRLSPSDSLMYDNELVFKAAPLAFDDVRLFLPQLAPGHEATINLTIGKEDQSLTALGAIILSDGAEIAFEGSWSEDSQGLDAKGHLKEFNPAIVAGASKFNGIINTDWAFSLQETALDSLTGTGSISMNGSQIDGLSIDSTSVEVRFDQGIATVSALTGITGAVLQLSGRVSPFAAQPNYNIDAQLIGLNIDPFLESSFDSDLNALIDIDGEGFTLADARTTLSLQMQPSHINNFDVGTGELFVNTDRGQIQHALSISGNRGRLQSQGSTKINKATVIDSFLVNTQAFDFAALMGDTLSSSFSSKSSLTGRIDRDGQPNLSLSTQLEDLRLKQFRVYEATLSGAWKDDQVLLTSAGGIQTGSYDVEAIIRLESNSIGYEITRGAFDDIDIGSLLIDSEQKSDLHGSLFLVGNGFDPATMSLSGQIELAPSRLNEQIITGANTWFALHRDTLEMDLNLELPEGSTTLTGEVAGLSGIPSYNITEGTFKEIDIGKIAGLQDVSSSLNGSFLLTGSGTEPASMTARADLILAPSTFNQVAIQEGKALLNIADDAGAISSTLQFSDGQISFEASGSTLSLDPSYKISGSFEDVDVARLLGSDSTRSSINLSITGESKGLDPQNMSFDGLVLGYNNTYQDVNIDSLHIKLGLEDGLLVVDTLLATSNIARFNGSGPIVLFDDGQNRTSDFRLSTALIDLAPLQDVLGVNTLSAQSGKLTTRLFGQQGALRMDTRAKTTGFVYDAFHLGDLTFRMTGEFDTDRTLNNADLTGQVSAVSIPGFIFEEINLEAMYDTTEVRFALNGRLDQDRQAHVSGSLFMAPEGQRIRLDLVNLNLDEDQWHLEEPATFAMGPDYRVENFVMKSGDQHIALDGVIDLEGHQNLKLDINNFSVGTVADLLGFEGLDGPLTSQLDITGPAEAPVVHGNLDMGLIAYGQDAGDLSIRVDYDSLQLQLDATLAQGNQHGASLEGILPIDLSLTIPEESTTGAGISQNVAMEGGVDFSIEADSMAIDWVLPFIDPALLDRLEGALTAHIKIEGTAQDPTLAGEGRLVEGKIRSPLLGVTYEDFESDITLRDNVIELANASLRSGDGFVAGNGSIELSDLTNAILNIDVTASQFLAIDTREYRATASGNMDLTGSLISPVLQGDITVLSADMFLNESTSSEIADLNVQLTEADLLMLEREFGIRAGAADTTTFDFLEALRMDLEILFERDVWIRSKKNPEMNIQFSGELDVSKKPYEEYIAFGSIELIPDRSYINQFGKRFDITLGNLTFNGPATDPQLDFEALYEVPARRSQENAVTIFLDAEGQLEDLDLTLRADPTMELTDILSYIATGQPASEALQLGGANQSLARTGAGFAINQGVGLLTGAIENLIQDSGLELDVIQIEPLDNAKGATITAGKYVTPRIFTAVSQPIGASDSDGTSTREEGTVITLELELVDSLLLRLLGGESVLQINLLWHHSY